MRFLDEIPSLLAPLKHRNSFIALNVNLKSPRKNEGSQWICNRTQDSRGWQSQPPRVLASWEKKRATLGLNNKPKRRKYLRNERPRGDDGRLHVNW